ncbi:MAG: DUF3352 domain-containing protein [Chloroflexota bacterium]
MDELDPRDGEQIPKFAEPEPEPAPAPAPVNPERPAVTSPVGRPSRTRWAVGGLVAVLSIVGAVAAAVILGARPLPEALRYLPADSRVVIELRPDLPGDQRQNLGNLLANFPGFADQSTLGAKLDETFDRIVSQASNGSVDYATRVKPLLAGPLVAALGADGLSRLTDGGRGVRGLLVATTDGSASCEVVFGSTSALETHRDVQIRAIGNDLACAVDGRFLLAGDADSIRSGIDAHIDRTGVDTNARFKAAYERLDGEQIGLVFVDGTALAEVLKGLGPSAGFDSALAPHVADWMVVGLRVVDDAIQVELQAAPVPETEISGSVPTDPPPARSRFAPVLPADTLGFVEAHGMGANLQRALGVLKADGKQADLVGQIEQALSAVGGIQNVASWIEDLGVAAIPVGDSVGGVVLIRGTDAAAVSSRVTQLRNLLILASTGTDITVRDTDHDGVTITRVDLGDLESLLSGLGVDPGVTGSGARFAFSLAMRGDVLLVGVGEGVIERVLDTTSGSSLSASATYRRVIELAGSPNDAEVFVAIDGLLRWVESSLPSALDGNDWTTELKPYVEHFAGFGASTLTTETGGRSRLVITVK